MAVFLVYATKSLISYIKVLVFVNKSELIIKKDLSIDINWYIWYATVLYKGWWINGNVKNPLNNIRRKNLLILLSLYGTNPLKLESDFKRMKNSFSEADFFLLNFRQQKNVYFRGFYARFHAFWSDKQNSCH